MLSFSLIKKYLIALKALWKNLFNMFKNNLIFSDYFKTC